MTGRNSTIPRTSPKPFPLKRGKTTEQSRNLTDVELKNVKEELVDIFIFLTYLSEEYKIDLFTEVENKIAQNAAKYPVEKAKGSAKKYTDL